MNVLKIFSQSLLQKLKSFMSLLKCIFTTIWNSIIYNNGDNRKLFKLATHKQVGLQVQLHPLVSLK
jgi:hypothetical protein